MLLRMEGAHYRQLRILVVDDDHDVADSLAAVLEMLDYDTCVTYSGTGAIELAGCFPPDVVILDINMPGLNGWQTARHLRTDRRMERAIFIAHTAVDGPLVRKIALQSGFQYFVPKGELASLTTILDLLLDVSITEGSPTSGSSPVPHER